MLELFYSPGACSLAPHIALEEAGANYELRRVAIAEGANRSADYLAINPRGRVPSLREGDWILDENPAVLVYIARSYPQSRLLPEDRRLAVSCESLLAYFASSVHIAFAEYFRPERFTPDPELLPRIKQAGWQLLPGYFREIDARLAKGWLLGREFTVADTYPLVFYRWGIRIGVDMSAYANWSAHTARMLERPAVQRAMDQEQITMGPPGAAR